MIDPRDAALRVTCPCEPVPLFGVLKEQAAGQRVLVASNGLFLEVRRSWLHSVTQLAELPQAPPLPYGMAVESLRFEFGKIPVALIDAFVDEGRKALPNEVAGALVYNASTKSLRLVMHESIVAGPTKVRYRMPNLLQGEELAIDLHTHGRLSAFWSDDDDADDQGVKVCGVFGDLHQARPSAEFRLVINGHYQPLSNPWKRAHEKAEPAVDLRASCPTLVSMGFDAMDDEWNTF